MKPRTYVLVAIVRRLIGVGIILPLFSYAHVYEYIPKIEKPYSVPETRQKYGVYARLFLVFYMVYLAFQLRNEEKLEEELTRYDPSRPTLYRPP